MAKKKPSVWAHERTMTPEEKAQALERKQKAEKLVDPPPASLPLERPEEVLRTAEELEAMAQEEKPAGESSDAPSSPETEADQDAERNRPSGSRESTERPSAGGSKRKRPPEPEVEEDPEPPLDERKKKAVGQLWEGLMLWIGGKHEEARTIWKETLREFGASLLFRLPIWNTLLGEILGSAISLGGVLLVDAWKKWKAAPESVREAQYEIKSDPTSPPDRPGS